MAEQRTVLAVAAAGVSRPGLGRRSVRRSRPHGAVQWWTALRKGLLRWVVGVYAAVLATGCSAGAAGEPGDGGGRRTTGAGGAGGSIGDGGTSACPAQLIELASPDVIAERLARFLWAQAPSDELMAQADAARTPAAVEELATRMLQDARAQVGVARFFGNWLRLDDLPDLEKPEGVLTPTLIDAMMREAPAFGVSVALEGEGTYDDLFLASHTFMNEALAQHYGVDGVVGDEMRQVAFPNGDRKGLLGGAGVLTRFSGNLNPPWPPRRFWLVFETLLCDQVAIPPAVATTPRDASKPIRQDLEEVTADGLCASCHATVNPIGTAFLKFDTFGRFMTADDQGRPLDTAGSVPAGLALSTPLTVEDQPDLIEQLLQLPESRRCFVWRLLNHARSPDPLEPNEWFSPDATLECSVEAAHARFEESGRKIRDLLIAVTGTAAFLEPH